jgi:hypothetical protein
MLGDQHGIDMANFQKVPALFEGNRQTPGFIFTLNQDLFMERHFYSHTMKPTIPGINQNTSWFSTSYSYKDADNEEKYDLPTENKLDGFFDFTNNTSHLFYIKLHGSMNWTSAVRSTQMVIGVDKEDQIIKEPLLRHYHSLFTSALAGGKRRLVVIGYGFGDPHINLAIVHAIRAFDLRLYVISPSSPDRFRDKMSADEKNSIIWKGLGGYYPYSLSEMFPKDGAETIKWQSLKSDLLSP